jgi:cytochrome c peroxidase
MGARNGKGCEWRGLWSLGSRALLVTTFAAEVMAQGTIGSFPEVAVPPGNPLTREKVLLGKALFFEEQLSSDDTMACATCHLPEAGGADPRAGAREPGVDRTLFTADDEFGSPGMLLQSPRGDYRVHSTFGTEPQATNRNAPTVIGAAFFDALFWDLRAGATFRDEAGRVILPSLAALETQAVAPPLSSVEMAHEARSWSQVTAKLARVRPLDLARDVPEELARFVGLAHDYRPLFERAFGTSEITRERVAMAIASYERTLVADRTPFDLGTMTSEQELGLQLFLTRGNCSACHGTGGVFSDGFAHFIALPGHPRAVKTPTLRNVGLQRRLMSSGQLASLDEAIRHYESIGFLRPPLDAAERRALLAFLGNALTDPRVLQRLPPFDRPTLRSELEPPGSNQLGEDWPGTGGVRPLLLSRVPSNLGSADFRIGIARGRGGAAAFLAVSPARAAPGAEFRQAPLSVDLARALIIGAELSEDPDGQGIATFHLPLPDDPALIGLERFVQGFVRDPNSTGGVAATRGARYELFSGQAHGGRRAEHEIAEARQPRQE